MGKVKDLRRRQRAVKLREDRLRRNNQLKIEELEQARKEEFGKGRKQGIAVGVGLALEETRGTGVTVTMIRRNIGQLHKDAMADAKA